MFLEEFISHRHEGDMIFPTTASFAISVISDLSVFTFNSLTQGGDLMRAGTTQSNRNMEIEIGRLQDQWVNQQMHILRDRRDLTHRFSTGMSTAMNPARNGMR